MTAGILIQLAPLFSLPLLISQWAGWEPGIGIHALWAIWVLLTPLTITFFAIHGKQVVDGAQDNLSGITTGFHVLKGLKDANLQHTRIKFISFGSEETGLRGSTAYAKQHFTKLKNEQAHLINLDGILVKDQVKIVKGEPSCSVKHSPKMVDELLAAFTKAKLNPEAVWLPVGATDAASFSRAGLPATSIVCLPMKELHPTYHTRLDTVDNLDPSFLETSVAVLIQFAKDWDAKQQA